MSAKKEQRFHYAKETLVIPVASKSTLQAQKLIVVSAIFATLIPFVAIMFVVSGDAKSPILLPIVLVTVFTGFIGFIVFYVINKKKSQDQKAESEINDPSINSIVVSPLHLSFPASLALGKKAQRHQQDGGTAFAFDIASIDDLETQPGSKNSPPQIIVKLKKPGAGEEVYRFKNPLKKQQLKEMYQTLHRFSGLPEERSPFSESAQRFRRKKYIYLMSFVFGAVFGLTGFFILLMISAPLHYFSALFTVGLYSVGAGFGLAIAFKNNLFRFTLQKGFGTETPQWLYFVTMIAVCSNFVIGMDRLSASNKQKFETFVNSKKIVREKNRRSYRLNFDLIEPQSQYIVNIDEPSEVRVSRKVYKQAVVGRSKIMGDLSIGLLGLPYISSYKIESPDIRRSAKTRKTSRKSKKDLQKWQAQIPNFPKPDNFQTVRYSSGALRSKVPVVDGQYHGVAEYFHANGQLYGKIIWVNGQKEGRHQLFRPDGTLEGDFSYHRGQLHGESRWYDDTGSLKETRIFFRGQALR